MPNGDDDEKKRADVRQLVEASQLAWIFPVAIGLGFGCGYGLDKLFGTRPWLTAIFTALGAIAAFINLFRIGTGRGDRSG